MTKEDNKKKSTTKSTTKSTKSSTKTTRTIKPKTKVTNTSKKPKTSKVETNKTVKMTHTKRVRKPRVKMSRPKFVCMCVAIFLLGVLLIVSSYAWFSTSLNVKIRNFNMVVTRNSGLSISFDAITYDNYVEISRDTLITNLRNTYPTNSSQWAAAGLTPVSTNGINNPNEDHFDIFASGGVRYRDKKREDGFITTLKVEENDPRSYNNYIAFDLFFKNVTGSPVSDNLYLDAGTEVTMDSDSNEEMQGLVNSLRIGFLFIGSAPLTTPATTLQAMKCQNNCKSIIYEPNSTNHTDLSIERAQKYNIDLVDGEKFPTYGMVKAGGPIWVKDAVSGSKNMDPNFFQLQNTMVDGEFNKPLFRVPDGVTKARVYVWIEGQDIDSLETNSDGADISISINFIKDTAGYQEYN